MPVRRPLTALVTLALLATSGRAAELSLAGPWSVLLDRQDNGESHGWHTPAFWNGGKEPATVRLPGSLQSQKIGDLPAADSPWTARIGTNLLKSPKYAPYQNPGDFKTPFWLTPDRVYVGPAWYHREIDVPPTFNNGRITLTLERPHWETTLWLDGKQVAPPQNSLSTPHVYDLTDALGPSPAGKHTLILRIDNRIKIPVGLDASAVTDQTQTNWNGIVGDIHLRGVPRLSIEDVQAYPDLANRKLKVKVTIANQQPGAPAGKGTLLVSATRRGLQDREEGFPDMSFPVQWDARGAATELEITLPEHMKTWDEFSPMVYDLKVTLKPDDTPPQTPLGALHSRTVPFGLRSISTKGPQLLLNGKPLYLRGTLECAIFPLTGYPPAGSAPEARAYWTKIYSRLKDFGLNHLRFHSWCPPEIAFTVADEMGVYLQIEAGVWAAFGTSARPPVENRADDAGGQGGAALDTWIVKETDAMLRAYGNHPSFLLMAAANEPGSRTNKPNADFLAALVDQWKAKDPRHLYTAGSNWPNVPNAQFQVMSAPRLNAGNRANRTPSTTLTYSDVVAQWPMPVISHESGQWCAYPNFDEIPKYTGALHPGNLQIFQDFLGRTPMGGQAKDFVLASGKWQVALYKEEIEALLRTPSIGGFQLLDLHDFPGQGTAPVGVLDAFWDPKPYITADIYRAFCGPIIPLALLPKRVYHEGESLTAAVRLAHYGGADLPPHKGIFGTVSRWRLTDEKGATLKEGSLRDGPFPAGALSDLGELSVPLRDLPAPARYKLEVTVQNNTTHAQPTDGNPAVTLGPAYTNAWDFWLYPPAAGTPITAPNVRIARTLDDDTRKFLEDGGRVLLIPHLDKIPGGTGNTRSSFTPIFWNRITFQNPTKEHTLSILCNPAHQAFAFFPTDIHTDWQWHDLLQPTRSKPMLLDAIPAARIPKPLLQYIDDWDTARRLALAVEAVYQKEGDPPENAGKLLICSIDLLTDISPPEGAPETAASPRPVARQLLSSLVRYVSSDRFLFSEPTIDAAGEVIPAPSLPVLTAKEIEMLIGR
jgi:hypothetical protein